LREDDDVDGEEDDAGGPKFGKKDVVAEDFQAVAVV
jgi:hypothetical protein